MADPHFLLVVAGDQVLRRAFADQVAELGYRVATAGGAPAADEARASDLILIAGPPAGGGMTALCRLCRKRAPALAILLVDSADEEAELRRAGASDCLVKPIRLADLAARLASLLQPGAADVGIEIGRRRFLPAARLLRDGERDVRLTEKEAAILLHLHRAEGRVVPRAELLEKIWGYGRAVDTHTIETHIYRLRRKLGGDGLVQGVDGGYCLSGPRSGNSD